MADALRVALGCWGGRGSAVSARLLRSIQKKPGSSTAAAADALAKQQQNQQQQWLRQQ
jgi:hypothetical protein